MTRYQKQASSIQHPETSIQHPASSSRPFIIPIFLPHAGCPHQCVFCNQVSITGSIQKAVDVDQIRSQIHQFLGYKNDRRKPVQISFYGGNFLGLKIDEIRLLLDLATEFIRQGHVDSIRFSTRPDTITPERLDIIAAYPVATNSVCNRWMIMFWRWPGEGTALRIRCGQLSNSRNMNMTSDCK